MRKLALALLFILGACVPAHAQFTNITGTILDPTGAPYVNCRMSIAFVPSTTATTIPTIGGSTFQTDIPLAQCDSFGALNPAIQLVDNNQVSDGHTGAASQWRFNVSSQDGKTNFFCLITITGASQNITSPLQACAAPLPPTGGGGGNFVVKNVPCASTIIFTMAGVAPNTSNTAFKVDPLNCNVTTTSVAAPAGGTLQQGAVAQFTLKQNNVGGFSFAWPSNFIDQPAIQSGANATTNASFWYDGANWHAQTFPASGGGGGSPAGSQGTIQSTNGTVFSTSNLSEPPTGSLAGSFKVNEDAGFCGGPNPFLDIRCNNSVAGNPNTTPYAVGLTATCTNGNSQVPISSASTFQNGYGVVLYGCGAPHSMATPSAPTVTPMAALTGTNTGIITTNVPTGSATYNYRIFWRDQKGGLTASSSAGSTTTGAAALGTITVNVSSESRTNDSATYVTATAHPLKAGCNVTNCGEVYISGNNGLTDPSFRGWYLVSSVADSTHFTISNTPLDTRQGAPTSATGGTATFYLGNRITAAVETGGWQFYVCSDRANPGTYALIGTSKPQGTNTDLTFDDFGSPFMDSQKYPPYVTNANCTAGSPTSDHLSTTVTAGGGTTTLTLAQAPGTSVGSATIRLDAAPGILATAQAINANGLTGGTLVIPATTGSNQFVVNSFLDLTPYNIAIDQRGALYLNETIATKAKWYGDRQPQYGNQTAADIWQGNPVVTVNTANPGIYNPQQFGTLLDSVSVIAESNTLNGALLALYEGGFNMSFLNDAFGTSSSNSDYLGIGLYLRGSGGQSATNIIIDRTLFSGAGNPFDGANHTPLFYCNQCGQAEIRSAYVLHRGIVANITAAGGQWKINHTYINGGINPLYAFTGGSTNWSAILGQLTLDTFPHPCVAAFSLGAGVFSTQGNCNSGLFGPGVQGIRQPLFGVSSLGTNALPSVAQNRDTFGPICQGAGAFDGVFNTGSGFDYCVNAFNTGLATGVSYPIWVNGVVPSQPTCTVQAGGSLAIGSYTFVVVPVWWSNGEGTASPKSVTCTTTSGNQTIQIGWSVPSGNPKGMRVYFSTGGGYAEDNNFTDPFPPGTTSFNWSAAGGNAKISAGFLPTGGPSMMMQGVQGFSSPLYVLNGPGFSGTLSPASFTANRTFTFPDASGTVAVSGTAPISVSAAGAISCANCFDKSTSNNIGAFFVDIGTRASPGNPSSGSIRLYADSTSGNLTCLTSAGANCIPGGGGGTPGGSTTQVQFNAAGAFAGNQNMTFASPALSMGSAAGATGQVKYVGVTSGTVTTQSQDAAGTWTFKWPTTAGTSGQPLVTDGTGIGSWATLGYAGGGTGATSFTSGQLVGSGASAFSSIAGTTTGTNPILKLQPANAANTALTLDTAATPTADILDINVNTTKTSWFDSGAFLHTPQTTYTGSGALVLSGSLLTCPGALSGTAIICLGDSATGMGLLSDNGGNFKPIAQFSNASPAAHGVGMAGVTAPQINFSAPGTIGNVFISGGVAADGAYGQLDLANANSHTGILPTANGGTGASSISGANIITVTGAITVGHCASFNASTVIQDAGAACGGGSSPARLDQITAATAGNTIGNTTFAQRWNWALTGSTTAFIFGESAASTGASNIILEATTAASSTATPFQADNNGVGILVNSVGFLTSKSTGGIDNNMLFCDSSTTTKCIKNVLSSISAATTRNKTWTDTAGTVAEDANTLTLTNKTFDTAGTGNVFKINGTSITAIGGNTGTVGTTSGTLTSSNLASFDANHNIVDSGVVAANAVTASSTAAAAKQVWTSGGANKTAVAIDFPQPVYAPAANCVNAVAGSGWSTGATPVALCRAGTNNKDALLSPWGASDVGYFKVHLPNDWDSGASLDLSIDLTSTDATNGHTIIMQASTVCAKGDGSTTDDVAFNAAQSFGTITLNGNANRTWNATLTGATTTGCAAGSTLWVKISRTTDTATNVGVYGATVDIARLLTVQAN